MQKLKEKRMYDGKWKAVATELPVDLHF